MAKALEINWKFEKSNDLYKDIGMREASGNHRKINRETGYIGLYQFGEPALVDAGYYKKAPKPEQKPGKQYNNDWTGKWTGKNGVNSKEDFMNSHKVQDIAVREYHQIVWRYLKDYHKYEGQEIGGIVLTKSGMIAAGHLVGHDGVKKYIDSNGVVNPDDKLGTTCYEYLKGFCGYDVDYSTEKLIEELELEWQQHQATGSADKSAFDMSNIQKVLKYAEILSKFNAKCSDILDKFASEQQKELSQNIKNVNESVVSENAALISAAQSELDTKIDVLEASANAQLSAATSRLTSQAEADSIRERLKTELDQGCDSIKNQIDAQLSGKQQELCTKNTKLIAEKKEALVKQFYSKKEQVDNYLSQILSKMEVGVTNNSEQTLESDAEQFANQLQQELLGSENQLEHAA